MTGIGEKFEKMFCAAAFAEEGEFETARQIMAEDKRDNKTDTKKPQIRLQAPGARK